MPSLPCLISALTQAGRGDLLFRFTSAVQSCCGEGRALQADVVVYGEHSLCSGRAASSFGGLSPGAARLFPPRRAARAARCLAPSPLARCAFSLRGPSARRRSGLRKSLDRNPGLFAGWEGVASLGLSLPPFPSPCLLPPAGMGRLFSGVSQSLCFANRRRCVRPVNFSLALSQFKKSSLRLLSGPSGRSLP